MTLLVSVHLREGENPTNVRAEAVAMALERAGCVIKCKSRSEEPNPGTDLVIQTGIGKTAALMWAIKHNTPYLIAEAPFIRHAPEIDVYTWSSWGYGGLAGGSFAPPAPSQERWKPILKPMKAEGSGPTVVIAQKPTDHSLRGADHGSWLLEKLKEYPGAEIRPHPLMWLPYKEPLDSLWGRAGRIVTYTSTLGAEALYEGVPVVVEHWGGIAYGVTDREAWSHELSWRHAPHEELSQRKFGRHILSGYEEALDRARRGWQEVPRDKAPPIAEYPPQIVERIKCSKGTIQ